MLIPETHPAAYARLTAVVETAESPFVVRFDEHQKLFRVWNTALSSWAPRPGFSDQRVALAVAASLVGVQATRPMPPARPAQPTN